MRTLHVGLRVSDRARSVAYYTTLGYQVVGEVPETPIGHLTMLKLPHDPFVSLELVDPRYYHLDTCLAALDDDNVVYYPGAFRADSLEVLERLYPDAVRASREDAEAFGLNCISDGLHVVIDQAAGGLVRRLADAGYLPVPVDLSELVKAGGNVKCCTLELRA